MATNWSQEAGMSGDVEVADVTDYVTTATNAATAAEASETAAASSATDAAESATSSANSATASANSATSASNSATSASNAQTAAESAKTAAELAETNAEAAKTAAQTAQTNAETAQESAQSYAANALASQTAAATSETNSALSATSASNSATAASQSASAADTARLASLSHSQVSEFWQTQAGTYATQAGNSATAAAASLASLSTEVEDAQTAASDAAASASAALVSETAANVSEGNAEASAISAASSAASASASADAALSALDNFDDRYLGQKSSDPALDNDGNPLIAGALYYNSTSDTMKVYDGTTWRSAYVSGDEYVLRTGDSISGNLAFGDNDKAIFGADSDLQIYSTGAHSVIQDLGTGNLYVDASNLYLRDSSGWNYAAFTDSGNGGTATLFHTNNPKLTTTSTGIDVTGTATMDGLTVDGGSTVDAIELTASTSFPTTGLTLNANGFSYEMTGSQGKIFRDAGNNKALMHISVQNDISFYEDTGTTAKFFWDASAESLIIGETTPVNLGDTSGTAVGISATGINLKRTCTSSTQSLLNLNNIGTVGNVIEFYVDGTQKGAIGVDSDAALTFIKGSGSSEAMRIDSTGDLTMTGGGSIGWANYTFVEEGGYLYVYNGSTKIMRVDSSGNAAFAGDVEANATL